MEEILVSIILVTHNGGTVVDECISSLKKLHWTNTEIIVVDNASTDDTLEHVNRSLQVASILRMAENRGYGAGGNAGAHVAKGEILLFMNQDAALSTGFLDGVVSSMSRDEKIGVCGGTVVSWDGKMLVSIGQVFERWTGYGLDLGFGSKQLGLRRNVSEVFSPNGSAFAVRRDVFREIGGFNESLFMYFDETDLSWRARIAGYRVVCSRESVVRHKITQERAHGHWSRYYIDRNSLLSAVRNYQLSSLVLFLPTSFATRVIGTGIFAMLGRRELSHSAVRALKDFVARFPRTLNERSALSRLRRVSDRQVMRKEVRASPIDILSVFTTSLIPYTGKHKAPVS